MISSSRQTRANSSRDGVALVLVLAFLVIMSALVIAFFTSAGNELQSSQSAAASVSTRQLADTATNLVMSQIAEATNGQKDASPPEILAWASQPGMIRTYDQQGMPHKYYKLYSSANSVIADFEGAANEVNTLLEQDVPPDWHEKTSTFVDLNAPVRDAGGVTVYPIVDPRAQKSSPTSNDGVDGFEIIDPPGFEGLAGGLSRTRPSDTYDALAGAKYNPAPMPVRWLYVLSDGTLLPPSGRGSKSEAEGKVSFGSASPDKQPTAERPIVGRIAFWADDDTSKVNINTASEGVFWDRPWTDVLLEDKQYAERIPVQNEFQRYTGHTAMTCLSPVLGWVMPYATAAQKKDYYFLVPRVMSGGTFSGTEVPLEKKFMTDDYERLFASVDEMAFHPEIDKNNLRKNSGGIVPEKARELLERGKFFLTANNRAPEVNMFNKPRVNLWPMQSDSALRNVGGKPMRNAKDKLLAFCSSTALKTPNPADTSRAKEARYYFQRASEYSKNGRRDADGYANFSGEFPSSQHPSMDFTSDNVWRNRRLLEYLQDLTGSPVPGFGGTFDLKYNEGANRFFNQSSGYNERDQILTSAFDYLRTQVNQYSTSTNLTPQYDYAPTRKGGPVAGETQLIPLRINLPDGRPGNTPHETSGHGRFATVSEAAIVFYKQYSDANGNRAKDASDPGFLRAVLLFEYFNPTPGPASWSQAVRIVVKGLEGVDPEVPGAPRQFEVSNHTTTVLPGGKVFMGWQPTRMAGNPTQKIWPWNFITARVGYAGGGHKLGFMGTYASLCWFKPTAPPENIKTLASSGALSEYPFFTNSIPLAIGSPDGGTFNFHGGNIIIEIYSGFEAHNPNQPPNPDLLVQRLHMKFPEALGIPLPRNDNAQTGDYMTRFATNQSNQMIRSSDTVRSVEVQAANPTGGDLRIVHALKDVPQSYFSVLPEYNGTPSRPIVHTLRTHEAIGQDNPLDTPSTSTGTATIRLISTAATGSSRMSRGNKYPAAAHGTVEARNVSGLGDFDSGFGNTEDGAYINKIDEGNHSTGAGSYFNEGSFNVEDGTTFSPNRQISSAIVFGSLPTGVRTTEWAIRSLNPLAGRPWQTLLFTPYPASRSGAISFDQAGKHPGFGTTLRSVFNGFGKINNPPYQYPPDHLWLDLFTMPIVEPYAISEPLSTAGKINLNYQIAPFTYIKRATGLHAVLRSTRVTGIPHVNNADKNLNQRYDINPNVGRGNDRNKLEPGDAGTLSFFDEKFKGGDLFRSASQICDVPLIPKAAGVTASNIGNFWNDNKRTGDNVREYPYGHIYPRVTTKSNTYTVHMRVQALRKGARSAPDEWDEARDRVVGEYRGSSTIERYVDAADKRIPDFALRTTTGTLDPFYRYRILTNRSFSP